MHQYSRHVSAIAATGYASGCASGMGGYASGMRRGTRQVLTLIVQVSEGGLARDATRWPRASKASIWAREMQSWPGILFFLRQG